jgi:ribA/ribD-fused uncharacterized protein
MELVIPPDNRILYFARDRENFGFLSHFHPAAVELDGFVWPSAEHAYQSHKSLNRDYVRAIREAGSPGKAKRLASYPASRSWFAQHDAKPRPDWNDVKADIMRRVDLAKFSQNDDLRQLLLATGDAELVEDSTSESFWGIGQDGSGPNWAGQILMEVRDQLRRK